MARAPAIARIARLGASAALFALTCAASAAAAPRDPTQSLLRHYSPVARIERKPAPSMGARVQRWWIISARGDSVHALWRPAPKGVVRPWTAVMMGGFHTGDRAALLLPEDAPFNALAVNWPWRGPRRMTAAEFAVKLPAIQRAVLRSPSTLALGLEAVARTPGIDPGRIVVVGASLGVPPALAALRLTAVPDAIVLVDGGADLELLIREALVREGWLRPAASISAAGAYQWLWPMEPMLNAPAAASRPVLIMNSTNDQLIPRASSDMLRASLPHATVRWRSGDHLNPIQRDVIGKLSREVDAWLRASGTPSRPSASLANPR